MKNLEGSPSGQEEPKKKASNIFSEIGKMDNRKMDDTIHGILEAGKQHDINWFKYEEGDGAATRFLDALGQHTERVVGITAEVNKHLEEGTAHMIAIGKGESTQRAGYFIPVPDERNKHFVTLDNGEVYDAIPKRPGLTNQYNKTMGNKKLVVPEVPLDKSGIISDGSAARLKGVLDTDKYGVHLRKGLFEETLEAEYQIQRIRDNIQARLEAEQQERAEVIKKAEELVDKTYYDSFNPLLDGQGNIPQQRTSEGQPLPKKEGETM